VRGVVDDEAQRLVAELFLKDCRQSTSVCLVDTVVQADAASEATLTDQFVESFNAIWAKVKSAELPGWGDERRQRDAAPGTDPEFDDVVRLEAFNDVEVLLDPDRVLADREQPII
jgi:hypothetical protein